jgi:hypothetical protein
MAAPRPQRTSTSNVHPPQPRPNTARNPSNGSSTNSATRPPSAAPVPSLDELLAMTDDEISHMSISVLKTVLFQNHVNARMLLEKSDLVARVRALLGDERHERAREATIHAREEEDIIARQHAMKEEQRLREEQVRQAREQMHNSADAARDDGQHFEPKLPPPPMMGTSADLERNGLCVVCQDEEANIAIVDCGYVFTFTKCFCPPNKCLFIAIWQCAATVQILSCPRPESAHFAAPVSSRMRVFYAYSNHNVVSPCFSLFSITSSPQDPTHSFLCSR